MSDRTMTLRFKAIHDALAELSVETVNPGFTLTEGDHRPNWPSSRLGFSDAHLFEFEHYRWPGEFPWEIRPVDGGRLIPSGAADALEWNADELALIEWVPADFADGLLQLSHHLPEGTYYLAHHIVRPLEHLENLPPQFSHGVMLGNDWAESPGDHLGALFHGNTEEEIEHGSGTRRRRIRTRRHTYAGLVGSIAGCAPDLSQPLLGISVLDFAGGQGVDATLFFSCLEPAGPGRAPTPSDTVLLVIPRTGPLVYHAEPYMDRSPAQKAAWAEKYAERYALQLAPTPWYQ